MVNWRPKRVLHKLTQDVVQECLVIWIQKQMLDSHFVIDVEVQHCIFKVCGIVGLCAVWWLVRPVFQITSPSVSSWHGDVVIVVALTAADFDVINEKRHLMVKLHTVSSRKSMYYK
jgi:hypothetical protein